MASDGNRLTDDQPSSFSLNEILDSVRSIVRPMAEEKGVPVRVSIATNPHAKPADGLIHRRFRTGGLALRRV